MWDWGSNINEKNSSRTKLCELLAKPLEERQSMSCAAKEKYPHIIPIIITRSNTEKNLPDIDKIKFLFPKDNSFATIIEIIRKRVKMDSTYAMFLFVGGGNIPSSSSSIAQIYEQHKNKDGFLYITYNGENTFG